MGPQCLFELNIVGSYEEKILNYGDLVMRRA